MAEGFARSIAGEKYAFYSAGSAPSGKVNPKAIESMAQVDIDLAEHSSKGFSEVPDHPYTWAITMGCGDYCPDLAAENREDWKIPDPKALNSKEFATVRDLVRKRVEHLVALLGGAD